MRHSNPCCRTFSKAHNSRIYQHECCYGCCRPYKRGAGLEGVQHWRSNGFARKTTFSNSHNGSSCDAAALADVIIKDGVKEVHFFCGTIRRDVLPHTLRKANILVEEIVVYQTRKHRSGSLLFMMRYFL
jgi:hypothetical protein